VSSALERVAPQLVGLEQLRCDYVCNRLFSPAPLQVDLRRWPIDQQPFGPTNAPSRSTNDNLRRQR
ncbi:MAG: hypothetical protein WA957_04100, partial [Alteraurantiacibacter sp.]